MKKMFLFLIAALAFTAIAADTYDYKAGVDEGASFVRYTGAVDMTADSIGNHYTQAMFIGEANQGTGMFQGVCANVPGTESVNVILQLSQDRQNWIEIASPLISALATTVVYDTLNVIQGVNRIEYKNSTWMRLKFDGQTGNPKTTVTWSVFLPKNTGAPAKGAAVVLNKR